MPNNFGQILYNKYNVQKSEAKTVLESKIYD